MSKTDLISRQSAYATALAMYTRCDTGDIEDYRDLMCESILALPSAQQWIPCSERLPETNGRYIVTRGLKACNAIWNRVYIINYSDLMGLKAEKIWWDGNVGKSDFQEIDDVLAWKPLEEPYKGEQE